MKYSIYPHLTAKNAIFRSKTNLLIPIILFMGVLTYVAPVMGETIPEVVFARKQSPVDPLLVDAEKQIASLSGKIAANPKDSASYILLARILLRLGLEGEVSDVLSRMEQANPAGFMEEFQKSLRGDKQFCNEFIQYAYEKHGEEPAVRFIIAKSLREHNFLDRSKAALDMCFQSAVTPIPGAYALGADLALQENRYKDAVNFASKELEVDPSNNQARLFLIWGKNMCGEVGEKDFPVIEQIWKSRPWVRTDLGILYGEGLMRQGQYSRALSAMLVGICFNSGKVMQQKNNRNLQVILSKMTDEDIQQAISAFFSQERLDSVTSALVLLNVGRDLESIGRYRLAREFYAGSLQATSFFARASYLGLASVIHKQGLLAAQQGHPWENLYQTSYNFYTRALDYDPGDRTTRYKFERFYQAYNRLHDRQNPSVRDIAARLKATFKPAQPSQAAQSGGFDKPCAALNVQSFWGAVN